MNAQESIKSNQNDRILIISGGGATGAWGAGLATSLVQDTDYHYKAVIGTSTGGLIAPFVLNENFDKLREGYTNITSKDIFSNNPFKIDGDKKGKLKMMKALFRILFQKKTLGESKNLKKTIKRLFTSDDYQKIINQDKRMEVAVVNLLTDAVEYKSIKITDNYSDFVDWMWASANFPVFMSLFQKKDDNGEKQYYIDGGIKESIPLERAIQLADELDIKNIDVIVHSTGQSIPAQMKRIRAMSLLTRTVDIFRSEVRKNDIEIIAKLAQFQNQIGQRNTEEAINVNFYFMPQKDHELIDNQLIFEKEAMNTLWERGKEFLNDDNGHCQFGFTIEDRETSPLLNWFCTPKQDFIQAKKSELQESIQ